MLRSPHFMSVGPRQARHYSPPWARTLCGIAHSIGAVQHNQRRP